MAAAPPKPKAGGKSVLKGKVGPVPVPVLIFAVVGVGVYLYLRHRAKTTSQTSAGTNSGTDTTGASSYPSDSTGGGAAGGATGPDLSSLRTYYGGGGGGHKVSTPGEVGPFGTLPGTKTGGNITTPGTVQPGQTLTSPPASFFPSPANPVAAQAAAAGFPIDPNNGALYGDYGISPGGSFDPAALGSGITEGLAPPGIIPGTQAGVTTTGQSTPPAANPQPPLTTIPTVLANIGATTGPGSIRPNQITGPSSSRTGTRIAPAHPGGRALQ